MPKMLKALGIDVADLMRVEPLMVRDMQRVLGCAGQGALPANLPTVPPHSITGITART
jgi:hypothetical protein